MLSFLHDELRLNVDDCASDGSGRLDSQVEVLYLLVDNFRVDVDGCGRNRGHFTDDSGVD